MAAAGDGRGLGVGAAAAKRIGTPDLVAPNRWGSVRATLKLVNWDAASSQAQSTEFLDISTKHDGPRGYYDVFRSTELVADRWRQMTGPADQEAVRTVLSTSELRRCWPDMMPSEV